MIYKIKLSKAAGKQLADLPRADAKKIAARIDKLASDPFPPNHKKLEGEDDICRIRQGDYRILYSVFKNELLVEVVKIGHRREVYR